MAKTAATKATTARRAPAAKAPSARATKPADGMSWDEALKKAERMMAEGMPADPDEVSRWGLPRRWVTGPRTSY